MLFNLLPEGTYRVTQRFGQNAAYYKKYGHLGHNGLDFAPLVPGTRGVVLYAPHDGYVRLDDEGIVGYGRYVELLSLPYNKLGRRRKSDVAHLEKFLVSDGQFVSQGDPLGIMGSTGDSSGIHTHWTYKVTDRAGITLDRGNGYNGAVDIARYVRPWELKTLG